jgi:tRNA 2-selenouridine synthase
LPGICAHASLDRPKSWRPLIVCWRGGQRSGSMTYVFRRVGWDAQQLEGGYKTYRRLVVETSPKLPRKLQLKVICGATGSGKSRILQAIGRLGEQVLDLEELACHKGSVLGVLPDCPQPSQKMFESRLLTALQRLLDPIARSMSKRKAARSVRCSCRRTDRDACAPASAFTSKRLSPRGSIFSCATTTISCLPPTLNACLHPLRTLQSAETLLRWQDYVRDGAVARTGQRTARTALRPALQSLAKRNYGGFAAPARFTSDDLTPVGVEALALKICGG